MRPRSIRTLTIALAWGLATGAAAGEDAGLRLKIERQLRMAPAKPERDSAKFIEADRIEGEQDRSVVATGNVVLRQRGATITADRVEYTVADQTATATGNVRLERAGDAATGPRLVYRLDNDTGEMEAPVFELPRTGERRMATRGSASRAVLAENHLSRLFDAQYTSCPAPRDDWYLSVRELEIDSSRNVGAAYTTTVFFLGVPILYSPYLSFPLDNKRRSGFLAPTFGTSARSGFEMALPYYWNIAENRDATITPKVFTRRGLQVGGEFRYLERTFAGQVDAEYLPNDRVADADRYFLGVRHHHRLWPGWHASVHAQKVSDDDYFRDLSTKIAATSQTNLPRDAVLAYGDDVWAFSARALSYQTLQDPVSPVPIPYRIIPQLLEPRLYYLNVPFRDQSRLPNFTTAESDFNFAQIFTENRFVGGDRIGDANQLTLALTSRLIESATGLERFKGALGQVYYFRPQRVRLDGGGERDVKSSDILALASSELSPRISFDIGWQYTPNLARSEKVTVAGHYHPRPGSVFNAAYRYARGAPEPGRDIEQVDFSTQWPVTRNLSALARWNWSLEDRKLVEGLAGFEYNAGCWQLRAVAHRFITATQQYSTSFQIQLELSGLTRIGINPLETIRQNITGYRRIDEVVP